MNNIGKPDRVLWIAPNLNHYKVRFLSRLAANPKLELVLMAGRSPVTEGHRDELNIGQNELPFEVRRQPATKRRFAVHPAVYFNCLKTLWNGNFDIVLMPAEKKHLPLILWFFILRMFFSFRLVSYNHPVLRSKSNRITILDRIWSRAIFSLYNQLIFYTLEARDWAVREKIIAKNKAAYANNTLDTVDIQKNYKFEITRTQPPTLLFIGRLVANKRLDLLFEYFDALKGVVPGLKLIVIGDGPDVGKVKDAIKNESSIKWQGAIVEEQSIAEEMKSAHVVFIPGASGLSIVHAFAYGKPYVTLDLPNQIHGPELAYLRNAENGLLLDGDFDANVDEIQSLLSNQKKYDQMCGSAFKTAQKLSVDNWCEQMSNALLRDVCGKVA